MVMHPRLTKMIHSFLESFDQIGNDRKNQLEKLAAYISDKQQRELSISLNFICTHNSRRSHISQIWAATAAAYYHVPNLITYSGGTEATAFNPRAVAAMERAGFQIENPGGNNPHYKVSFSPEAPSLICFSKVFDDETNPKKEFAAIMTCSHADENCPFVPGTEFRLPITYKDPKEADSTPRESVVYDERVQQIGREIFYAFHQVNV